MKFAFVLVVFLSAAFIDLAAGDCWSTGCQPNSWAIVGCEQYGRVEVSRQSCGGGFVYRCCTRSSRSISSGSSRNRASSSGQGHVSASSITYSQFSNAVTSNGGWAPRSLYSSFVNGLPKAHISTKQEAAMLLANLLQESDLLATVEEYVPRNYAQPGCDAPGRSYHGRGYIQLTGCSNYRAASYALYGDYRLVRNPDVVALDNNIAWAVTWWYWRTSVHNAPGVAGGKFGATIRAINGALECGGWTAQAARRVAYYRNVRAAFGLHGNGDESGCYN